MEARSGGTCVVRVVMSGFGTGTGWDQELENLSEGMQTALHSLRLHLTRGSTEGASPA